MLNIPVEISRPFDELMNTNKLHASVRGYFKKWLRFYLDFCFKYEFDPENNASLPPFMEKLTSKGQSKMLRRQAYHAVQLYYSLKRSTGGESIGSINHLFALLSEASSPKFPHSLSFKSPFSPWDQLKSL